MKLLLDENLSRRLVPALEALYPGSAHVSAAGLDRADDEAVWRHARERGFARAGDRIAIVGTLGKAESTNGLVVLTV